nr:hypothetical protein [Tanacetum cinerariifolium]
MVYVNAPSDQTPIMAPPVRADDQILPHIRSWLFVSSVSSDSSKGSVGTSARRVILFESGPSEDPSPDHIPPLPATLPFLLLIDDSLNSDIPDTPPSPTHGTPFTETTLSTQRSPATSSALQHSSTDALSDSASSHSSFDHSLLAPSSSMRPSYHLCLLVLSIHRSSAAIFARPSHDSSSVSPSRKRGRSPAASIPLSSPIPGALSYARVDHLPSPKRIRKIDECISYADALRDRRIDARVIVEAVDRDEVRTDVRGPVEVRVDRVTHPKIADDILELAQEEGAIEPIKGIQRDQGHMIMATGQQSTDMLERIREVERVNMRLRYMMDVVSQRVTQSQRRKLRVQRELRQIWRFIFYDRMRIARLEAWARRHLGYRS